jgi:hypothetical protein
MSNIPLTALPAYSQMPLNFRPLGQKISDACKWQFSHIRQQYLASLIHDTKKGKK